MACPWIISKIIQTIHNKWVLTAATIISTICQCQTWSTWRRPSRGIISSHLNKMQLRDVQFIKCLKVTNLGTTLRSRISIFWRIKSACCLYNQSKESWKMLWEPNIIQRKTERDQTMQATKIWVSRLAWQLNTISVLKIVNLWLKLPNQDHIRFKNSWLSLSCLWQARRIQKHNSNRERLSKERIF